MADAIEDLDGVSQIEGAWRELAERRGNAFLTPEWFRCWFEQYGHRARPFIPVLKDSDDELRGLLPLVIDRSGRPRTCRIAGTNLGDCFAPVSQVGEEAAVGVAVGTSLGSVSLPWSVLALERVEEPALWLNDLQDALPMRVSRTDGPPSKLPSIDLRGHAGWEGYLASRSSHLRKRLRWLERRTSRDHAVAVRRTERADQLDGDVRTLFELHDRRWEGRGGSSIGTDRARAFHRCFAERALERGWLRLWFLEFDDAPVAAWYGWRVGDRYAFCNGGVDPDHGRLSPGMLLLARVIESAFEEGADIFDFLLGDEAYKARFADQVREVRDVRIARALPHPAAAITSLSSGARRAGRSLPPGVRRRLGVDRLAGRLLRRRR
jgi:CelD/BcsL family acetyltransferase involved in cellulose biosynthesis